MIRITWLTLALATIAVGLATGAARAADAPASTAGEARERAMGADDPRLAWSPCPPLFAAGCQIAVLQGRRDEMEARLLAVFDAPAGADAAAGFAAEVNNTTIASVGTGVTLHEDAFNVRAGATFWWPEGCEPMATQGNTTIVVRVPAPADAITLVGTLYVRELG